MTGTLVICTRNRPADLARTLASLEAQAVGFPLDLLVVDAGDPESARESARLCGRVHRHPTRHLLFDDTPSLARQRNFALGAMDPSVDIVFFVDDDVSLEDGYLDALWRVFLDLPDVVGAGGHVHFDQPVRPRPAPVSLARSVLLLESSVPGRVLSSGGESRAHLLPLPGRTAVEWLSGSSCAYRAQAARTIRFDDRLEGYSLDEDLDFSFRIRRLGRLIVEPAARLVHHRSKRNRYQKARYAAEHLIHRYWFVEKNIRHPLRKPAFWWSTLGRLGLTFISKDADAASTRDGLLEGIRTILKRSHPLLRREKPAG